MGASSQKSIHSITTSKYSFSHPKSTQHQQLSVWRYSQQDLQQPNTLQGESLKWPFKFYNDQGYIITLIINHSVAPLQSKVNSTDPPGSFLSTLRTSINMLQVLYSFCHNEIEEYLQQRVVLSCDSKYSKEKFSLWIYVYTGENLSSTAKLKLIREAMQLERYIARGGTSCVSKLYHDCKECIDIGKELKNDQKKEEEYYASVGSLVEDRIKDKGKEGEKKVIDELYREFSKYRLLRRTLLALYQPRNSYNMHNFLKGNNAYPLLDSQQLINNRPLILSQPKPLQALDPVPKPQKKPLPPLDNLNDSSPFDCQITQINFRDKKKGMNEESNIMEELSVLNQKRTSTFVTVSLPEEDYIVLTDYGSMRQFEQLSQLNIRLVINLASNLCFNYYLNDVDYQSYYLTPLPTKQPAQAVLFQTNIEHIVHKITHSIITLTAGNRPNDASNNRLAIHSAGTPFSDENVAVLIGYLIVRYLYSYEKAFERVSQMYQKSKGDPKAKLWLHKIYVEQLLALEGRVLITSVGNYGVSLNSAIWRGYQISNNHCSPSQHLIARFIGQLTSHNQLTSLPNYSQHCYILLSNTLVPVMGQLIQKWQKDQNCQTPANLTGIKVMLGKDFPHRDTYLSFCKEVIPLLVKYELVNRSKCVNCFNNQFLYQLIQQTVASNVQVEIIEKSFRKAQPFTPLYNGFQEQMPTIPTGKVPLPYNPKERLTFKYPFLRPTWEPIQDDQHYFILQVTAAGASVQIVKGKNWAGLQTDKEGFFASLVELYLQNISEDKIWIAQEGEQSFLGDLV